MRRPASSPRARVLVVEDDRPAADLVANALSEDGYRADVAYTAAEALRRLGGSEATDLVVLDLHLPDLEGVDLCLRIRQQTDAPILVCSVDLTQDSRTAPLRAGADMFLPKPFEVCELLARVEALLRRWAKRFPAIAMHKGVRLCIDPRRLRVTLNGRHVGLSATEFRLLCTLAEHPGEVVAYDDLIQRAYDCRTALDGRGLTNHVSRLRRKLARHALDGPDILAARGRGYRLTGHAALVTD